MSSAAASVFFIQQNFTVGDIAGNARLLADGAAAAAASGAAVALAPEMALCGYPAEDLLYSPALRAQTESAARHLAAAVPPQLALVVGLPVWENGALYNAAALMRAGAIESLYKKSRLPNTSVFDEKRHFTAGSQPPLVFAAGGARYAVQICQDIWDAPQLRLLKQSPADAILVLNGSPFETGKQALRRRVAAACARACRAPVYYANSTGGQDDLVFDGASFSADANGKLTGQLPAFAAANAAASAIAQYPSEAEAIRLAITMGIRDYFGKSQFAKSIVLGLSGGADSALVAALAATAVGAQRVLGVQMPTQYTSQASLEDSQLLARRLGIQYATLPLAQPLAAAATALSPHLSQKEGDLTAENLQARLRGTLLMALANNQDALLLATGNKSEFACGYATLYGDMNGGYAPLKDLYKTQVWVQCRHYNSKFSTDAPIIPERINTRPPSAELRPDQTDQDSLPPYDILDAMIADHLSRCPPADLQKKYGKAQTADFLRRLQSSEYKRRQAPPGPKISACAFGKDWRMPIASGHQPLR